VLDCKGKYKFIIKENPESYYEFKKRTKSITDGYGAYRYDLRYFPHTLRVSFFADVSYNNENYSLSGMFYEREFMSEADMYSCIAKILSGDKRHTEEFDSMLNDSIVSALKEYLKNNKVSEIKKIIEENGSFSFDFKLETNKIKDL